MAKEKQQMSSREQRHRERARRWRIQRLKSFLINFSIIAFAVGAIFLMQYISNIQEVPDEETGTSQANRTETEQTSPILPEDEGTQPEVDAPTVEAPAPEMALPVVKTAPTLSDGEVMILTENCIRKNKEFIFTAKVDRMGVLVFRHGDNGYGASWINLDKDKVEVYTHSAQALKQASVEHGLTFGGDLKVVIRVDNNENMSLTIHSGDQEFSLREMTWMGYRGAVEVESIGNELTDVTASWNALDADKDIWVLGDGYLGTHARNKWPYYIQQEGYDNALYSGFYNATSEKMYDEWRRLLNYGTPKYAVWCPGMNESDEEDEVNENWEVYLEQFLDDCESRGITPILATIPNTVKKNHVFKNEIVRNSGYRYVDFALVVGASKKDSVWLGGMLSGDEIHPTNAGAVALAEQFLKDVPEAAADPEEKKDDESAKDDEAEKTDESSKIEE